MEELRFLQRQVVPKVWVFGPILTEIYLLRYLGFFRAQMNPGSKIKRSLLRLEPLFLKAPYWWNNFGRSSFQTGVIILALGLFSTLSDHFFNLNLFLSAAPKGWKKWIGFPDAEFYAKSFEEKKIKNQIFWKLTRLWNSRCSHQQPYNLFSIFCRFP